MYCSVWPQTWVKQTKEVLPCYVWNSVVTKIRQNNPLATIWPFVGAKKHIFRSSVSKMALPFWKIMRFLKYQIQNSADSPGQTPIWPDWPTQPFYLFEKQIKCSLDFWNPDWILIILGRGSLHWGSLLCVHYLSWLQWPPQHVCFLDMPIKRSLKG